MQELTDIFVELFSRNRGPGYGIKVINANKDLSLIEVEIVFLSGRTYCCFESGCHVPRNLKRLIELAAIHSFSIPETTLIKWRFRIEAGAKHDCSGRTLESTAYEFDAAGMPARKPNSD